ncbi:P63C domain-containing protein [Sphingopyxis sp. BSNA05]|uniref:P63C domain-containing protein n=1 Tax=Sphingopyxis sp. BSNA05 TaxID=1236614 RepID=UPI0020B847D7|nr:P63C domain-containing protein [Sphingopyxis sp. BSNA05]
MVGRAREDELHSSQEHLAKQAEVLMQAFAKVGIVALIDEATGYQLDRAHDALRLLLGKYIAEGLQKWIHTFPDTFFPNWTVFTIIPQPRLAAVPNIMAGSSISTSTTRLSTVT